MEMVLTAIAVVTLLHLIYTFLEITVGYKSIQNLNQIIVTEQNLPSVSVILSALNEEEQIGQTVNALLSLNYSNLEVIVVNDRSTDRTLEILQNMASNPNLRILNVQNLPENWLGKNHALHLAGLQAKGDWLLFTDADVMMKPDTLLHAMSYIQKKQLDHLTIYENHIRNSFWLTVLMLGSYTAYSIYNKPWRIRLSWSKRSLGHGAFNLVNKSVYFACGGHQTIALKCLDDLMLGKLIKDNGFRQDTINSTHYVEREWYHSLSEMIEGLKKNSFAYFNFSVWAVMRTFLFSAIYFFLPLAVMCIYSGFLFWLNLVNIFIMLLISLAVCQQFKIHPGFAPLYPLGILITIYTILLSMIFTFKNKGIIWRGTYYPLDLLRSDERNNRPETLT